MCSLNECISLPLESGAAVAFETSQGALSEWEASQCECTGAGSVTTA